MPAGVWPVHFRDGFQGVSGAQLQPEIGRPSAVGR
jgi:hypothetical protein